MLTQYTSEDRATDLSNQVLIALRQIIRAIDLHSRQLVNKFGLTGPQLNVLRELESNGPMSVSKLAKAVHLSQATVTGIVCRLETKEFVQRQRNDLDRRVVEVILTESASQLLAQAPPLLQENFTNAFDALKEWEKHQIIASLQRIAGMMSVEQLDATPMLAIGPLDTSPEDLKAFLNSSESSGDKSCNEPTDNK